MPDREKLMEALTLCANGEPCIGRKYRTCPYSPIGKPEHYNCGAAMAACVLAILREQKKPVRPIPTGIEPNYNCGKCRLPIQQGYPFCPWCGRAVKWDG